MCIEIFILTYGPRMDGIIIDFTEALNVVLYNIILDKTNIDKQAFLYTKYKCDVFLKMKFVGQYVNIVIVTSVLSYVS